MARQSKRVGKQTIQFGEPPVITGTATVVGPKEGQGPLGPYFDQIEADLYLGQDSWEKAEETMLSQCIDLLLQRASLQAADINLMLAGDLLNQIICANFTAGQLGIPFLGLYGACSTMFEGLALGAMLVDGGFADRVLAATCSHYETAERQYRFPTEQGVQRPPSAQWTVTGAGAALMAANGSGLRVTYATVGRVIDRGIKDPNDMGAAMAPAAVDTIMRHLVDTGRVPGDYDLIVTGDLGRVGHELVRRQAAEQGITLGDNFLDCGLLIYSPEQDAHAGGSGCACSAVVTLGYLYKEMLAGRYHRILCVGTGALLSTLSSQQGKSIPGIGQGVVLETP